MLGDLSLSILIDARPSSGAGCADHPTPLLGRASIEIERARSPNMGSTTWPRILSTRPLLPITVQILIPRTVLYRNKSRGINSWKSGGRREPRFRLLR